MATMLELTEIGCGSRVLINESCNSNRDDLLLDIISSITSNNKLKSITVITGNSTNNNRLAFYNQRVPEAVCHTEFKKITLTSLYAEQCSAITHAKHAGLGPDHLAINPVMLILDSGVMLDEFLATKVSKDILANTKRLGFIVIMLDERPTTKLFPTGSGTTLGSRPDNIADFIYCPVKKEMETTEPNKYNVLTGQDKTPKYYMLGHDFELTELDVPGTLTRPSQIPPAIIISESEIEPVTEQQVNKDIDADAEHIIEDDKKEDSATNTSNATPAVVTQQATSSGGLLSGLWWLLGY